MDHWQLATLFGHIPPAPTIRHGKPVSCLREALARLRLRLPFALADGSHRAPRSLSSAASSILETFDEVMAGALDEWRSDEGLMVVVSDHGNMEDLSTRRHTLNMVPTLVVGERAQDFADGYKSLTDFVPACDRILFDS